MTKGKYKRMDFHRELMRNRYLGKHLSEEHKKNIGLGGKGRIVSEETRKRIRIRLKGRNVTWGDKISIGKKGKPNPNKGRKFPPLSEEAKLKISRAMTGRKFSEETRNKMSIAQSREKHPNWQGGISFMGYPITFNTKFKRAIRKRDNYICMLCGKHQEKNGRSLDVHHINYDKDLTIPENCISLCKMCHPKTNINKKQWIGFFQSILSEKYNYQYKEEMVILNFLREKK